MIGRDKAFVKMYGTRLLILTVDLPFGALPDSLGSTLLIPSKVVVVDVILVKHNRISKNYLVPLYLHIADSTSLE